METHYPDSISHIHHSAMCCRYKYPDKTRFPTNLAVSRVHCRDRYLFCCNTHWPDQESVRGRGYLQVRRHGWASSMSALMFAEFGLSEVEKELRRKTLDFFSFLLNQVWMFSPKPFPGRKTWASKFGTCSAQGFNHHRF